MKILAIDPGTVRCGLAVSDGTGMLASPLPALSVGNGRDLASRVAARVSELGAAVVLVGYPLSMDGSEGARAKAVARLAEALRAATNAEVVLLDERLTSVEAHRRLAEAGRRSRDRRDLVDSASAVVLLQSYLDSTSRAGFPDPADRE